MLTRQIVDPYLALVVQLFLPCALPRQIMAHRHRHPEDQKFFRRLKQLFHVLEDEEAQPTRAGNPRPPQPPGIAEHGDPKTPPGVPRGGGEAQLTRAGNSHPPTPAGTAQAHGDPIAACPPRVLCRGGALGDNVAQNRNGTAGKGGAAREKTSPAPRSHGAVDVSIRASPSSCEDVTAFGAGERGTAAVGIAAAVPATAAPASGAAAAAHAAAPAAAPPPPAAAASDAAVDAAAARVSEKAIAADPEQGRGPINGRGGKCDGADVRIFCIWSRKGKSSSIGQITDPNFMI